MKRKQIDDEIILPIKLDDDNDNTDTSTCYQDPALDCNPSAFKKLCLNLNLVLKTKTELKTDLETSLDSTENLNEEHDANEINLVDIPEFKELYEMISPIGQGGFGAVFKVLVKKNNEIRAVKIVKEKHNFTLNKAIEEVMQTQKASHNNYVIQMHKTTITKDYTLMLEMDFFEHGSLHDFFVKRDNRPSSKISNSIIEQTLEALDYMKTRNMIHRDIKPGNILIRSMDLEKDEIEVCVSDFGLAKTKNDNSVVSFCGTRDYIAPEVYNGREQSIASDIYALGVTLCRIMTGSKNQELLNSSTYEPELINKVLQMMSLDLETRYALLKSMKPTEIQTPNPDLIETPNPENHLVEQLNFTQLPPQTSSNSSEFTSVQKVPVNPLTTNRKQQKTNTTNQLTTLMMTGAISIFVPEKKFVFEQPSEPIERVKVDRQEASEKIESILCRINSQNPTLMLSDICKRSISTLPLTKQDLNLFIKGLKNSLQSDEEFDITLKFIIEDTNELGKCLKKKSEYDNWLLCGDDQKYMTQVGMSMDTLSIIQHLTKNKDIYLESANRLFALFYGNSKRDQRLSRLSEHNRQVIVKLCSDVKEIVTEIGPSLFNNILDRLGKKDDSQSIVARYCIGPKRKVNSQQQ